MVVLTIWISRCDNSRVFRDRSGELQNLRGTLEPVARLLRRVPTILQIKLAVRSCTNAAKRVYIVIH